MLQDDLISRYGPTMTIPDIAEVFHVTPGAIHNRLWKKKLEIPVFKLGGKLVAETHDVVEYIQQMKILREAKQ